jgi:hypothetical protein
LQKHLFAYSSWCDRYHHRGQNGWPTYFTIEAFGWYERNSCRNRTNSASTHTTGP